MRVGFKHKGKSHRVDFRVSTSRHTDIIRIAKSTKDLEILDVLRDTEEGDRPIQEGLKKKIEFRLNVPINIDFNYNGAGYGFNVDFYGVIDKLKK